MTMMSIYIYDCNNGNDDANNVNGDYENDDNAVVLVFLQSSRYVCILCLQCMQVCMYVVYVYMYTMYVLSCLAFNHPLSEDSSLNEQVYRLHLPVYSSDILAHLATA